MTNDANVTTHIRVSAATQRKVAALAGAIGVTHDTLIERLCDQHQARFDAGFLGEMRDLSIRTQALDVRLFTLATTLQTLARTLERMVYDRALATDKLLEDALVALREAPPSHPETAKEQP